MRYRLEREAARHGSKDTRRHPRRSRGTVDSPTPAPRRIPRAPPPQSRAKLAELGIASLPRGETLKVLPAPPFLRHHFPTAAYNAPPPFSERQEGIFWVNDLSLGVSDPKKKLSEDSAAFRPGAHQRPRGLSGPPPPVRNSKPPPQQTAPPGGARDLLRRLDDVVRATGRRARSGRGSARPLAADPRRPLARPPHRHRLRSPRRFVELRGRLQGASAKAFASPRPAPRATSIGTPALRPCR